MRLTSLLVVVTSLLFLSSPAVGELVRFDITGTLNNKSGIEPIPANSPAIGSSFTGSFVFDTSAVNTSGSPSFGTYRTTVPPSVVSLKVSDWEWNETSLSPTNIVVGNDLNAPGGGTQDSYEVGHSRLDLLTPGNPNPNLFEYWLFQWDLDGPSSIFTSTDLPQQAFSLAPWTTNRWSISQWGTPPAPLFELSGAVASFTSTVVPEPPSIISAIISLLTVIVPVSCRRYH
jgi:hypothetical protein